MLIKRIVQIATMNTFRCPSGEWLPLRPYPFKSLKRRFIEAWDVFTYKADAVYWPDGMGGYQNPK